MSGRDDTAAYQAFQRGQYAIAETNYRLLLSSLPPGHQEIILIQNCISECQWRSKAVEASQATDHQLIQLFVRNGCGEESVARDIVARLTKTGQEYYQASRYQAAQKLFELAVKACDAGLSPSHILHTRTRGNLQKAKQQAEQQRAQAKEEVQARANLTKRLELRVLNRKALEEERLNQQKAAHERKVAMREAEVMEKARNRQETQARERLEARQTQESDANRSISSQTATQEPTVGLEGERLKIAQEQNEIPCASETHDTIPEHLEKLVNKSRAEVHPGLEGNRQSTDNDEPNQEDTKPQSQVVVEAGDNPELKGCKETSQNDMPPTMLHGSDRHVLDDTINISQDSDAVEPDLTRRHASKACEDTINPSRIDPSIESMIKTTNSANNVPSARHSIPGAFPEESFPFEDACSESTVISLPETIAATSTSKQTTITELEDFDAQALARDKAAEKMVDKWFRKYLTRTTEFVGSVSRSWKLPRVKIAVLDTGIDQRHPRVAEIIAKTSKRKPGIKKWKSWLSASDDDALQDSDGHGTHCAMTLFNIAQESELYIAKVSGTDGVDADKAAKAVEWAVSEGVHIISMSFGFGFSRHSNISGLAKALDDAANKGTLLLAAAANEGRASGRTFPATHDRVICIHACDAWGQPSRLNPSAHANDFNFTILGEHVSAPYRDQSDERLSGTSVATPIAAGAVALVLEFARQHPVPGQRGFTEDDLRKLNTKKAMTLVLQKMGDDDQQAVSQSGYRCILPWNFLSQRHNDDLVAARIRVADEIHAILARIP